MTAPVIRTYHALSPNKAREFDWFAWEANLADGTETYGFGHSEADAIADLRVHLAHPDQGPQP